MGTNTADELAAQLVALCNEWGYRCIEVTVMADGRVRFDAICPRGYLVCKAPEADLPPQGIAKCMPTPAEALRQWQHQYAKPVVP